jgi:hypothetical protein
MLHSIAKVALLGGVCLLAATSTAAAQSMRPFEPASRSRLNSTMESRPTVSPYINLVNGAGGLSNYQTLVRPLIEEREELNRQWTELDRMNRQMNGMTSSAKRPESGPMGSGNRAAAVRYMHYSHYFGTR